MTEKLKSSKRKQKKKETNQKFILKWQDKNGKKRCRDIKKYQGPIKSFTKQDEIGSWIRNIKSILKYEKVPDQDWVFVLR